MSFVLVESLAMLAGMFGVHSVAQQNKNEDDEEAILRSLKPVRSGQLYLPFDEMPSGKFAYQPSLGDPDWPLIGMNPEYYVEGDPRQQFMPLMLPPHTNDDTVQAGDITDAFMGLPEARSTTVSGLVHPNPYAAMRYRLRANQAKAFGNENAYLFNLKVAHGHHTGGKGYDFFD